jgi:hypothetical protein
VSSYVPPAGNITNTTGTYGFFPSFGELLLYAFGLCGIRNTALTQQHFQTGRMAANMLMSSWSARGVNLWQVDLQSVPLVQGCATYNVPSNTIVILDAYYTISNGTTEIDRIMLPISRSEYASYSNKHQQGTPTVYWLDRLLQPTVTLYQTPNGAQSCFKYYRLRQTQDTALANGAVPEMPVYFLDAFTKGVAANVALSWAPTQYPVLKAAADEAYGYAADQNVETSNIYVTPVVNGYYR